MDKLKMVEDMGKMENIKINGFSFDGNEEDTKYIHAHAISGDHTLCGNGDAEDFENVDKRINCPACINIIEYCKCFKKNKHYKLG